MFTACFKCITVLTTAFELPNPATGAVVAMFMCKGTWNTHCCGLQLDYVIITACTWPDAYSSASAALLALLLSLGETDSMV
jgi:hypothetical protein